MRLELKLALIGALSKIMIFFILLILMQQVIDKQALRQTDHDLIKMKDKTMDIVGKIGINSFLNIEKDSVYASYNMLKDEYITIDLDGIDPSECPAVGTPEPGGLRYRQVLSLLRMVCKKKKVVGFDVVELSPIPGNHISDFLAARLTYKLICYIEEGNRK